MGTKLLKTSGIKRQRVLLKNDFCCISGVKVDSCSQHELFSWVRHAVRSHQRSTIMYANVHVLNSAWKDGRLRSILNAAKLVYCDGAGVVAGARLLGSRLPGRMTGADWIFPFCSLCVFTGMRVFILAGGEGVADRAAQRLRSRYPGIGIVGTHHGYVSGKAASAEAVALINAASPDIVLVGMGTPIQEYWIQENRAAIRAPVVWAVGALFDFVAEIQPRGPRWMLDSGFEWLFRLVSDPKRLWRRYLIGNPLFISRVLLQATASWFSRQEPSYN